MKNAILATLITISTVTLSAQRPADPSGNLLRPRTAPVVNINTATPAQLMLLPGVGGNTASSIIAARPFKAPAELTRVRGIKGKRFAKMAPFITTTGATTAREKISTCKAHETGSQCQSRIGDDGSREVIEYANGVLVIEAK